MDHTDIQSDSGSGKIERVELFRLSRQFENCARAFFRFESCVCSFSLDLDRKDSSSLPAGFTRPPDAGGSITNAERVGCELGYAREWPTRHMPTSSSHVRAGVTPNAGLAFNSTSVRSTDRQCAIGFHVEDAWAINLAASTRRALVNEPSEWTVLCGPPAEFVRIVSSEKL